MATIKIPESVCIDLNPAYEQAPDDPAILKTLRHAAKTMIEEAIRDELTPATLPAATEGGLTMNLTFAGNAGRAIRALARAEQIRESDAVLKMLYAAIGRGDLAQYRPVENNFLGPYLKALGLGPRVHQQVFADAVLTSLKSRKVGMVEASTGVGKTLGVVAAASELLNNTAGCAVVAAPTLQLVRQFADEHQRLAERFKGSPQKTENKAR